jgi:predicted Zn-dependent peptidase
VAQQFFTHTLKNGLVVVAEEMPGVESAAFSFLIPAGSVHEAPKELGISAIVCDMLLRGAGERDNRKLLADLEILGVQRGESASASHTNLGGATMAENLPATLEIYADILRRPHLPEDLLPASQQVILQELRSIEDDPAHKVVLELRKQHYPDPWGRSTMGQISTVESLGMNEVHAHYQRCYQPRGAILGVAGKIDWPKLIDQLEKLFGDWSVKGDTPIKAESTAAREKITHVKHESQQTQIAIAFKSVPFKHPDYFRASGAVGVLSGGMSSRLFTEVREKRGLCYSVYASYHTHKEMASVICYAGSTADRAQETLDVILQELKRLPDGIEENELNRLKARVKSGLIMQQESSSSRASSMAREWYHLGRVRTLEEIGQKVDELTVDSINEFLRANPPGDYTIVTLGSEPLTVPEFAKSS